MRFAIGNLIFYGETGVCRVEDIVEKEFLGEMKVCYKLQPIYQSCVVYTPADNEVVFMRPILTKDEANALIESANRIVPENYPAGSPRELTERYDKIIKNHDCAELLKLSVSIRAKRAKLIEQKKKLSAVDERFLKRAEDLLFGELAAAIEIEKTAMGDYIKSHAK